MTTVTAVSTTLSLILLRFIIIFSVALGQKTGGPVVSRRQHRRRRRVKKHTGVSQKAYVGESKSIRGWVKTYTGTGYVLSR